MPFYGNNMCGGVSHMKRIILKTAKKEKSKKSGGGLFYTVLFVTS